MYASKKTVTKGAIKRGEIAEKKNKEMKHGNGKITDGCEYRVQLIKDEHGFVKKRIVHYSPQKLAKIAKYNKMLEEYRKAMTDEAQKQVEGENDIKGMEAGAEQPVTDIVEVPEVEPVIATE